MLLLYPISIPFPLSILVCPPSFVYGARRPLREGGGPEEERGGFGVLMYDGSGGCGSLFSDPLSLFLSLFSNPPFLTPDSKLPLHTLRSKDTLQVVPSPITTSLQFPLHFPFLYFPYFTPSPNFKSGPFS